MSVQKLLKISSEKLAQTKIKNPALEAEIILSHTLNKTREHLLTHPEKSLTKQQISKFNHLIKRRQNGEPIAYLIGYKYFYGNKFFVNKNVLIPRPETELMVDAVKQQATNHKQACLIIDVGTGSGNIIISTAKLLKNKNTKFLGIDISPKALGIAKKNAKLNRVRNKIKFKQGGLLEPIFKFRIKNLKLKVLILANLPYGWKAWKNNCSMDTIGLKFEPTTALYTKKNGLALYEQLFKQIKKLYSLRRFSYTLFCEFDPRQTILIRKLAKKELPQTKIQIKKDLAGLNRLLIINKE